MIIDIIKERRSTRKFRSGVIDIEKINSIFEAGLVAPSPKNRQPWEYIVISDRAEKKKFADGLRCEIEKIQREKPDREDICGAPDTVMAIEQCSVLLLVCYKNDTFFHHNDGVDWNMSALDIEAIELMSLGASVENMLLEAQSLGVASLWCGDVLYAYQFLKKFSDYPVVSAICFGYADGETSKSSRKGISEVFKEVKHIL